MSTYTVDVSQLRGFAKNLKRLEPEVAKQLHRDLRAAGEIVAADARSRAAYSSRVPAGIRVRVSGVNVKVIAGTGEASPHAGEAAAFENHYREGSFRHPVFGHRDRWVSQKAQPVLTRALAAKQLEAVAKVMVGLDRVFEKL